jgi:hypothetical protein
MVWAVQLAGAGVVPVATPKANPSWFKASIRFERPISFAVMKHAHGAFLGSTSVPRD